MTQIWNYFYLSIGLLVLIVTHKYLLIIYLKKNKNLFYFKLVSMITSEMAPEVEMRSPDVIEKVAKKGFSLPFNLPLLHIHQAGLQRTTFSQPWTFVPMGPAAGPLMTPIRKKYQRKGQCNGCHMRGFLHCLTIGNVCPIIFSIIEFRKKF